jgi:hypothetical protein
MVVWCDNIDTKEDFLQKNLCTLNYMFFLISP